MENNAIANQRNPLSIGRIILLLLNYFVGFMFLYPTLISKITLFLDPQAIEIPVSLQAMVYGIMILISVSLAWPLLVESYQSWRRNRPRMFKINLILFFQLYLGMVMVGALVSFLSQSETSANQMNVISSVQVNPILMGAITLIYAPIVEEILFRGCIFRTLRPKYDFWVAALASAALFGLIHVFDSFIGGNTADLWYGITYSMMGFFMVYSYEKAGNIYSSMLLHLFNNLLAFLAIIIAL